MILRIAKRVNTNSFYFIICYAQSMQYTAVVIERADGLNIVPTIKFIHNLRWKRTGALALDVSCLLKCMD